MIQSFIEEKVVCNNIYFSILIVKNMKFFWKKYQLDTLIDTTDSSDSKKGENYWLRKSGTLALDGFNVEGSV